jgi:DNA-binding NarL/FixJ family response regulator
LKSVRIFIIDNHELVRRGIQSMLEEEEDMEIVGDSSSIEESLFQMVRLHPDIVLLGTQLPGSDWAQAINSLKKSRPGSSVDIIILASSSDSRAEVLEAGAARCLFSGVTRTKLVQSIRQVYRDSHPLKEDDSHVEEITEVVLSPHVNPALLLKFMCDLGVMLPVNFASIIATVGSWNKGTVITVRSDPDLPINLAIELANMPEVDRVEEQAIEKGSHSDLARKFDFAPRLGMNPTRRLYVTLKEIAADEELDLTEQIIN